MNGSHPVRSVRTPRIKDCYFGLRLRLELLREPRIDFRISVDLFVPGFAKIGHPFIRGSICPLKSRDARLL
jgi:hypothetical protein